MKKIILSLILILVVVSIALPALASPPVSFCTDSDGGEDIWIPGSAEDDKGVLYDNCDGASENLKEATCKGVNTHPVNIKCSDFGAICVSDGNTETPDYCECPDGYALSGENCVEAYVPPNNPPPPPSGVPEFGTFGLIIAVLGGILGLNFLRKN